MGLLPLILAGANLTTAAPPLKELPEPEVVVRGRTEKQLRERVRILTPAKPGHQVGRWLQPICLQVVGLDPPYVRIIKDTFIQQVRRLKLRPELNPRCSANVSVVIAANADEIAQRVYRNATWLFGDPKEGTPAHEWVEALLRPQPVRWFVANRTVPLPGSTAAPSRILLRSQEEISFAYLLVDAGKLTGISWQQLASYLTMVALSGPTPGATVPNSILSVFADRDAGHRGAQSLTVTDQAFLDALYSSDPRFSAGLSRWDIERRMSANAGAVTGRQ